MATGHTLHYTIELIFARPIGRGGKNRGIEVGEGIENATYL